MEQLQPTLVERLIESSIGTTKYNPDAARVLFELMVPNDLKDGLGELSNVVFVLDGHTASLPWELMTDGADPPLFTRLRMVRQLQSATSGRTSARRRQSAYVVGDHGVATVSATRRRSPRSRGGCDRLETCKFTEPGWRRERRARDVLGGLFGRPYRIVHLAGHGDFEAAADASQRTSGMVLDDEVFLTAAEVRKMAQVPELVFLNCCHIGQMGPEARLNPSRTVACTTGSPPVSREN